ncbi:MAG: trigger factor [Muribaculaceae bacterium]|nr:trigger factor [Muribaculaceae bacterium]MDD6942581.1 trigger factor [Bacteroidales bacterium]MDY2733716.1 trigger factor [Muribaculaceae bacterium]
MKINYNSLSEVTGELVMVVEECDYTEKVKKQLKELGKRHAEPGFRPGHVPAGLIQKKYGKSVLYDVVTNIISDEMTKYFADNNMNVLGNPIPDKDNNIDFDAKEFTFKFKVGVAPELSVVVDKNVNIPYYNIEVTDEMVKKQDDALRRRFGTQGPAEESDASALIKGEIRELNEDGSIKEDGVGVADGIVAPQYFKDAKQADLFLGKHVGDEVVFNPAATCDGSATEIASMLHVDKEVADNYHGDFMFTIREIITLKPAELNEEFFKNAFGENVKDEESYFKAIKEMIEASLKGDSNYRFSIDAKKVLLDAVGQVALPDEIIKSFLIEQNESLNDENIDEQYPEIREDLVWDLVKSHIIKALNISISDDDVLNTCRILARNQFAQYGMNNVPDEAIDRYAHDIMADKKSIGNIRRQSLDMKLFNALRATVSLDEKNVSVEEFEALFSEK